MAKYVTLGPITYISGNTVIDVVKAGVIIELDSTQAAALAGSVSYVSSSTPFVDLPRGTLLHYDSLSVFPTMGLPDSVYLAEDTGGLYEWNGTGYITAGGSGSAPVFTTIAPVTTAVVPTVNVITPYDATSGALAPPLPALAGLANGTMYGVQRASVDVSTNTVTITTNGADVFDSGATTLVLRLTAELRYIQVVTIGGVKKWKVINGNTSIGSLDNRYAFTRIGYGVAAVGDSITNNYGDGNQLREMEGPLSRACAESGQNPLFRGTFSTGGFTAAQVLSTHIPQVVALSPKPWACVILMGTNDAGASSGVGFSVTNTIATLTTACDTLRAANIQPILATLTPRSDVSLVNQNVSNYNRALLRFAIANGYDVVDYNQAVVNPATGGFLTGYAQSDNIHPDFKAVKYMGQALAKTFAGMQAPCDPVLRATHSADPTNLLGAQGHFQVDTNADGISDGFSNAVPRGATFTVASDPDGVTKWQRITQPSSATGNNLLQKSIASVVSVGDTIEAICRVQTSGFDAALVAPSGLTGGTGPAWVFTVGLTGASHDLEPAYNWHTDLDDGYVYLRGVVPSGATGAITINLQVTGVPVSGSVWVQYTEVCVRNLTALGLV